MTETDGWKKCQAAVLALIRRESAGWQPNGPAKAVADALIVKIKKLEPGEANDAKIQG